MMKLQIFSLGLLAAFSATCFNPNIEHIKPTSNIIEEKSASWDNKIQYESLLNYDTFQLEIKKNQE